jgi:predicted metal-dependent peptidase
MNTTALKKLITARVSLVLDQPFFGALALSLPPKEDTTCDTAWTDGRSLGYNPTFIESLTHAELTGLIAHEILHCAMGHPWRRDARDGKQFNVACDLAINGDLKDSGFSLPAGGLFPDKTQHGKSAEWIYARLPQPKPGKDKTGSGGQGTPQAGKGKPDPAGEVRDAPTGPDTDGTPAPTEGEWKQKTAEALQAAKLQGNLSGGMLRKVESALDARVDIKALVLRFFTERVKADYSWAYPNTRFLASGLYLPSLNSVSMGEVAVLVDTSGSTSSVALQFAKGILEQVLDEVQPAGVTLYFVDTKIHGVHRMEQGEPLTWEPKGGGGTCFKSFFAEIEASDTPPVCIIAISDLYASFPESCSIPTLWLTDSAGKEAPFGETIFVDR